MDPKECIGKPFVVYIDGEKHEIGQITAAKIDSGKLFVAARLYTPDEAEAGWSA